MPAREAEQTGVRIGVDVGGTFTDLVATDGSRVRVVKVPSTPPAFHRAVIEALRRTSLAAPDAPRQVVHGSTVATNALLQRAGAPVAFVTTEGFRDMLLIGRQNRPRLYALHVERPAPITPEENWFTVRERIDATGNVLESLDPAEVDRLIDTICAAGLQHVAVCLLFSFINPAHERHIGDKCAAAGLTVTLSSDLLPEFREYERASTTTINASLRPTVHDYLAALDAGLPSNVADLRIMQSAGGTLDVADAARTAAKLVLSGPAGGVIGAAYVARQAGFRDIISYDMGGTSTDVATILDGQPQWTTRSTIDGLPLSLPMFDIHTVGAGGGSIASVDTGGALRVGPQSAGADPGPACYGRGGTEPTVTDANLLLGRILPDQFLGGAMTVDRELAEHAIHTVATQIGKSVIDTAMGIIRVAEANMAHAVRAVTSQRGHDPRAFTLVSFGGAGGLHACALAETLEIPRVLVPPMAGVLSALGMIVAPQIVDLSQTVVHRKDRLDDAMLTKQFDLLREQADQQMPEAAAHSTNLYADMRFAGQSHEVKVAIEHLSMPAITTAFHTAYRTLYGTLPENRPAEIVTLRLRRIGHVPSLALPPIAADPTRPATVALAVSASQTATAPALTRAMLRHRGRVEGPALLIDPEATTYVPPAWTAECDESGDVLLQRIGQVMG